MRFAFAAILLVSVSGMALAAPADKRDTTSSTIAPEVGASPRAGGNSPSGHSSTPSATMPSGGTPTVNGSRSGGWMPPSGAVHDGHPGGWTPPPGGTVPAGGHWPPPGGIPTNGAHGGWNHGGSHTGLPTPPGGPVLPPPTMGGHHDRDGDRGSHDGGRYRHHRDRGVILYPWPPLQTTWPYPPYPYPPGADPYWYYPDDSDDDRPSGPAVPDNLPTASVPAYWHYCDAPDGYYPYVKSCTHTWNIIPISPPPPGAATPISYAAWQWCEESKSFFPYVSSCRAGFVSIPVTAPSTDGPPAVANWFFCDDPKGYLPYVIQCKHDWRAVPAVPPPSVKITVKDDKK